MLGVKPMNKSCLWLIAAIIAIGSSCLFANDAQPTYVHFKNYTPTHGTTETAPGALPDPSNYEEPSFSFKNLPTPEGPMPPIIPLMPYGRTSVMPSSPRK